jgi:hypothetical protein
MYSFIDIFKKYYAFFIIILFIFIFNIQLDHHIAFYADNSTKFFQAYSVIENHFKDDIIRCKWLKDFDYCRFHIITNTMIYNNMHLIQGVFPFFLSYTNAILMKIFGYSFFLIFPQIIFVVNLLLLRKYLNNITLLFLFLSTPLYFHYFTFSDVALSCFFSSFIFILLMERDFLSIAKVFFLGILTGLNIFFRYEAQIYIGILLFMLIIFERNHRKKYFIFGLGLLLSLFLFFILNYFYYGNILGLRLLVNTDGIFNRDLTSKFIAIIGNIWGSFMHPVGFFKYMFYLLIFYIFFFIKRKQFSLTEKRIYYSLIISFMVILVLAPNDSNVDYGTRYLSVLILPSFILLSKFLESISHSYIKYFFFFLMILSINYSFNYYKDLVSNNKIGKNLYSQIEAEYKKNALWIFHSNYYPNSWGIYLFDNKVIVIENQEELNFFKEIFNKKEIREKYKKVLIFNINTNIKIEGEENQKDRFFYEDEEVKNNLFNYFSSILKNHKEKEITLNKDNKVIIHFIDL